MTTMTKAEEAQEAQEISTKRKVIFWLLSLAAFIGLLILLKGILLPFVASLVLAYFLDPLIEYMGKKKINRTFAALILIIGFMLIFTAVLAFLLPILYHQLASFADSFPSYIEKFWDRLLPLLDKLKTMIPEDQLASIKESVGSYAGKALQMILVMLGKLLSGGAAFFNIVSLLVITPIVSFYVLRDWTHITSFFKSMVPSYFKASVFEQVGEINTILSGFIRGQATVCLCLAIFYSIALSAVGLDIGAVVGFGTGLLSFVPYVGALSGFLVSMGLGLAEFGTSWHLLWIVAVFGAGQVLEGYILTPNLVGDKTGLHPVWIIFAVLAGAYLLGFLGVLVAVPVAAVIGVLTRFTIKQYKNSAFYEGYSKPKRKA